MSPENADCLVAAGVDCCVLANNHVLDWGSAGLTETLEVLRRRGLQAAGAGRDAAEAAAPAILDVAGKGRVIVLSFAAASSGTPRDWAATAAQPGVNLTELSASAVETIGEQIGRIRRPRDVVIASIHWGANWGYAIPAAQRRFAHALVDRAKVSIVHGHSSHHPKAIEVYNNRLILYGCGDFPNDYEGIEGFEEFRDDLARWRRSGAWRLREGRHGAPADQTHAAQSTDRLGYRLASRHAGSGEPPVRLSHRAHRGRCAPADLG
jgi:poly-gamma-glutamate capsule biosynthesis protein CapA/YwtB (metallophosphatase superfamily)